VDPRAVGKAFTDLSSLMSKAEETVKLAEKFYSSFGVSSGEETDADRETMEELASMGIASPVTRESAGSLFYDELSRQLADFLDPLLKRRGGLITLPDVYCFVNKARGAAELVSPYDLIQSTKLFQKLKIPLSLRSFSSGVLVIQSAYHDEDTICAKVTWLAEEDKALAKPLTAVVMARELQMPLTIAEQHLLLAEKREVLCRDDRPDGLRFYYDFFKAL